MASSRPTKTLSLVQQRARQFEALATLESKPKECNWWLSDFRKSDPCDCEPCENKKEINDNADDDVVIDSENVVSDEAHIDDTVVDDVEDQDENDENDEILPEEESATEQNANEENDDIDDLPVKGKVVQAINDNVYFQRVSIKHHQKTAVQPVYEEVAVTEDE